MGCGSVIKCQTEQFKEGLFDWLVVQRYSLGREVMAAGAWASRSGAMPPGDRERWMSLLAHALPLMQFSTQAQGVALLTAGVGRATSKNLIKIY